MIKSFVADCRGATAIEYALIGSLIAVAIIGAILMFQSQMNEMFQYISSTIDVALTER